VSTEVKSATEPIFLCDRTHFPVRPNPFSWAPEPIPIPLAAGSFTSVHSERLCLPSFLGCKRLDSQGRSSNTGEPLEHIVEASFEWEAIRGCFELVGICRSEATNRILLPLSDVDGLATAMIRNL
jgi:hypothetical protein